MPSTAFRAVRASNMQPELCGSVVDRFSGRFQARLRLKLVREGKDVQKTRETGLQLFQQPRAWQPQPVRTSWLRVLLAGHHGPHLSGRSKSPPCVAPPPLRADGSGGIEFK